MRIDIPTYSRKILVVDDDLDNVKMLTQTLQFEGYQVDFASSGEEALVKLSKATPDMILLDINMPGMSGFDVLKVVNQHKHYISVIFISARSNTTDVVSGLDAGADDYICKPFEPIEMLARVRAQLRIKDLTDKLAVANKKLLELVDVDDLTGLYNMRSIYSRIDSELVRVRRYGRTMAVVMMDLDNFKMVNDSYDHVFGSFVLATVGRIIRESIRQVDFAARYGGDEFLIVLTETGEEGAVAFAERLRQAIAQKLFTSGETSCQLSSSIGVALGDSNFVNLPSEELVRRADHALYAAKRTGKNCVKVFDFSKQDDSTLQDS